MPHALPSIWIVAFVGLLSTALMGLITPATAQQAGRQDHFFAGRSPDTTDAPRDEAWTPFFQHEGVDFSFILYRRADNHNAGVVLKLVNENDYAVRYRLRLAFLSATGEQEEWRHGSAQGVLEAGQMKTGAPDSLFWVPFSDGRGIAEVRLPEYQIVRVE